LDRFGAERTARRSVAFWHASGDFAVRAQAKDAREAVSGWSDAHQLSVAVSWIKTFGGPNSNDGNSVQQTSDGGYVIIGSTDSDGWLVKTDAAGNKVWDHTFVGRPSTRPMRANRRSTAATSSQVIRRSMARASVSSRPMLKVIRSGPGLTWGTLDTQSARLQTTATSSQATSASKVLADQTPTPSISSKRMLKVIPCGLEPMVG
jgi:hypothetical protein